MVCSLTQPLQLPNAEEILGRVIQLVKPGGWLLLEESDDTNVRDSGRQLGPGMSAFLKAWLGLLHARGADPAIGRRFEQILESSEAFSEVHVKHSVISMSGKGGGQCLTIFAIMSV